MSPAALKNKLRPMLAYLAKLKRRMNYGGFLANDPLMAAAFRAESAIHELSVLTRYLSYGTTGVSGYSEPPKFDNAPPLRSLHPHDQAKSDGK